MKGCVGALSIVLQRGLFLLLQCYALSNVSMDSKGYLGTIENKFGNYVRHPPTGRLQTLSLCGSVQ